MTKMKKKLLLIVSLCLLAVNLIGCGSEKDATYNGYTAEELQANNQNMVQALVSLSDSDIAGYLMNADQVDELTMKLITSWVDCKDELGSFVGFGDFEVTNSNGTLVAVQTVDFTDRDMTLSFVYEGTQMEVKDITVDLVYTLGETMAKAAMNTAMGMGTVFVMLIVICLIISCFSIINKVQNKSSKKETVASPVVEQIQQREEQAQDDLELVAVIAAAIAAATGSSTDDFVVRSIKRR
ncbi:MAG: OadG family protein [bacterium]|nr:OadG family protein [bacterium]